MSRPLRFCMVTTFYPPYHFGGDAIQVYRLTESLARRGHRVDVVHSIDAFRLQHPQEPEIPFGHHPNVTVHALTTARPMASVLAAHQLGRPAFYGSQLRAILVDDYDVVHFHNISLVGGPRVLELGDAVKLLTAHDYWLVCPTHVLFAYNRRACTRRHCLGCTTVGYRRPPQLWRATEALRRSLEHVNRLIVPSRFSSEIHGRLGINDRLMSLPYIVPEPDGISADDPVPVEQPFFLYVGRLERLKGIQDLVRLFRDYDRAHLIIVGSGSYAAELGKLAADLPHVHFVGHHHPQSLSAFYRRAIALLVPSLCCETFGLTLAEALSHGTPVIARRIGALTENLEQSGGGLGFSDLDECREAMERLRLGEELRRTLGRRGQDAARRLWSEEAHLSRYLDLVQELLPDERQLDTVPAGSR